MSDNVISLTGGPTGVLSRRDACVETLRELLARAEAGEIVGVAVSALHHDNLASFSVGGLVGGYSMLGALDMAKGAVMDVMLDV